MYKIFNSSLSSRLKPDFRNGSSSLPRNSSKFTRIPKLNFVNFSVPTTPADSATWDNSVDSLDKNFLRKREFTSSSSSVEEQVPGRSFMKKTRSRLSLNLGVFDESPIKSPNLIPKFLRASFTKLMLKDRAKTPEKVRDEEPMSLPSFSSDTIFDDPNCFCDSPKTPISQYSPATKEFVNESLEKGMPIIPFPMPTMLIAENHIKSTKQNNKDPKSRKGSIVNFETPKDLVKETNNKNRSTVREEVHKKSLDKLLNEAKHELEQESQRKRKVSNI